MYLQIYLILFIQYLRLSQACKGFYIIANMANTHQVVNHALAKGANALSTDLQFDDKGKILNFMHGTPCDCDCCLMSCPRNNVCSFLKERPDTMDPCKASSTAANHLKFIAKKSIPLLLINCHLGKEINGQYVTDAAVKMVNFLQDNLFTQGYLGDVLIVLQKEIHFKFLEYIANSQMKHHKSIYYTIKNDKDTIVHNIQKLQLLNSKNIVFNKGQNGCWVNTISPAVYQLAAMNKGANVVSMTYTWNLDKETSIKKAVKYFNGIVTNDPGKLYVMFKNELKLPLATIESRLDPATSTEIKHTTKGYTCDCSYSKGGCTVVEIAPTGLACKCEYKGLWTCGGKVVKCIHPNSRYCLTPDKSIHSCTEGGGDCDGYSTHKCDCSYSAGGCKISKIVSPNLACKCRYQGFFTCAGEVVKCKEPKSKQCLKPDTSVESCVQGGGDCAGYSSCDCSYRSAGGCVITKTAPVNYACKCSYKGFWTCGGEVTNCRIKTAVKCGKPDKSIQSCTLGGGDCDGYSSACDCSYSTGGCTITKTPPQTTACKCNYKGFWTCTGSIVHCSNYVNHKCQRPDRSHSTCLFGGGDCGGYARRRRRFWGKKKDSKRNFKSRTQKFNNNN